MICDALSALSAKHVRRVQAKGRDEREGSMRTEYERSLDWKQNLNFRVQDAFTTEPVLFFMEKVIRIVRRNPFEWEERREKEQICRSAGFFACESDNDRERERCGLGWKKGRRLTQNPTFTTGPTPSKRSASPKFCPKIPVLKTVARGKALFSSVLGDKIASM